VIDVGYEDIRAAIERDGAIPAATKALIVAACAAACGHDDLARAELERGRSLGLSDREIADVGAALLLARGEAVRARFAAAAGGLGEGTARPASEGSPVDYFLDFFGVEELPERIAIMADHVPTVFAGYQRMHHDALAADPAVAKVTELVLVAVNAAELATRFVGIHAATARAAGLTDEELVEAVVCAIPVRGVAAWAAAAEALFPAHDLLADRHDIEQLFVRYFDRVDANDPEGASLEFSEDVEFEIMIGKRKQGRERFARSLGRVLELYERTSHHVSNVRTEVDGDDAHGLAYVYAYHRMKDTGEPWHLWARMQDRYRRIDGRWLITEHVLIGLDAEPMRPDIPREWYAGHPGRLQR
jgi:uncharacterized protein (TIGR02246 family)